MSMWSRKSRAILTNFPVKLRLSNSKKFSRAGAALLETARSSTSTIFVRHCRRYSNSSSGSNYGRSPLVYISFAVTAGIALATGYQLDGSDNWLIHAKQKPASASAKSKTKPKDAAADEWDAMPMDSGSQTEASANRLTDDSHHLEELAKVIHKATDMLQRVKDEVGAPGLVIAVTVDGKQVWTQGLGYSDVENRLPCGPQTSMRIASISKSMTMAIAGRLMDEGKLDLDKPVHCYVPTWPSKLYDGEPVTITVRHIVSHLGGVRHYEKCSGKSSEKKKTKKEALEKTEQGKDEVEFVQKEYLIKDHYDSVKDAVTLFQNDELCSKPGTTFLYTTHGWTLVSAALEGASGQKFTELSKQLFKDLGLADTRLDENEPLIYNRARYYVKDKRGRLVNAPYVDLSYKWAGGGFVSTVADLTQFGNAMLYSYQHRGGSLAGYLQSKTIQTFWSPVANTQLGWDKEGSYGMGWGVVTAKQTHAHGKQVRFYVTHTGGAIGASSALVVLPPGGDTSTATSSTKGVAVAIMANLQNVGLNRVAFEIARMFEEVQPTLNAKNVLFIQGAGQKGA